MKTILLLLLTALLSLPASAWAHGGTERVSERSDVDERLFVADAATGELVSIDLVEGGDIVRLSTPPFIMSLALTLDKRHLFVMRGRNTDRDWITVVNTGADGMTGGLRPPLISRAIPVRTPGPGEANNTLIVDGKDAVALEGSAEMNRGDLVTLFLD